MCSSSSLEWPAFAESNIPTRLAIPISPNTTARDFMRVFERAHLNCFPEHGEIVANGLMVQRKSNLYHLSDTLPLKHAFQHTKGDWFLQVRVCNPSIADPIGSPEVTKDFSTDGEPEIFLTSTPRSRCSRRRRRMMMKRLISNRLSHFNFRWFFFLHNSKRKRVRKNNAAISCSIDKPHILSDEKFNYDALSESMSVSGIITKYFSSYDEVNSTSVFSYSKVEGEQTENPFLKTEDNRLGFDICTPPPFSLRIPPVIQSVPLASESVSVVSSKGKKAEIGKRLLTATKSLGLNVSNRSPGLPLNRILAYEITDEDE
ncbi:hypothetical protein DM860_000493 [Cuscuta australis]|uniref:Uncharacterized protein n=1 Tax=Cuscuta australis TaxID=267555 RepID=A0A328D0E2_9ASTE|nr:hypothetical protein DM860_000493 [Cuscuta australis]